MTHFVLFDLDNTLVDSAHLRKLRDQRRWPDVYRKIQSIALFEGVHDVWEELRLRKVHLGIVTHSPSSYAHRVLAHVGLSPDSLVAYHDLKGKKKPSPYGYELCSAGRSSHSGFAVGDERHDLLAADAFGCVGVFAGWSRDPALTAGDVKSAGWIYAPRPNELLSLAHAVPR